MKVLGSLLKDDGCSLDDSEKQVAAKLMGQMMSGKRNSPTNIIQSREFILRLSPLNIPRTGCNLNLYNSNNPSRHLDITTLKC